VGCQAPGGRSRGPFVVDGPFLPRAVSDRQARPRTVGRQPEPQGYARSSRMRPSCIRAILAQNRHHGSGGPLSFLTSHVNLIGPCACYDEGRCAGTLYFDYHRQNGTAVEVARILNAYGPQRHPGDGRDVPHFIVQVLRGEGSLSTAMAGKVGLCHIWRQRCISLITKLGLTSYLAAAARRDAPASTARTTPSRKSTEQGRAIHRWSPSPSSQSESQQSSVVNPSRFR